MKQRFIFCLGLLAATGLCAQTQADAERDQRIAQERARIAAERAQLRESLLEQQKACYQRFAVNDCLRKAKRQQRDAQASLRSQEVLLNDEERQRKAAARLEKDAAPARSQEPTAPQ